MRCQSALLTLTVITLGFTLAACSGGSEEEGRIHVIPSEVVGVYHSGNERLELQPNGTYVQDVASASPPIHRLGHWQIANHFLDGSEVLLINAVVSEPPIPPIDPSPHLVFGDLPMYVHRRSGQVALARNEVADWYYERSQ
jgi:hypothetical protein